VRFYTLLETGEAFISFSSPRVNFHSSHYGLDYTLTACKRPASSEYLYRDDRSFFVIAGVYVIIRKGYVFLLADCRLVVALFLQRSSLIHVLDSQLLSPHFALLIMLYPETYSSIDSSFFTELRTELPSLIRSSPIFLMISHSRLLAGLELGLKNCPCCLFKRDDPFRTRKCPVFLLEVWMERIT
jgi:hypothetical protein